MFNKKADKSGIKIRQRKQSIKPSSINPAIPITGIAGLAMLYFFCFSG